MVGFNQVADFEMVAGSYEPTTMLNYSDELLRIQWTATLPKGNVIGAVWWIRTHDGCGCMKTQLDALHQVTFRTTREIALAAERAAAIRPLALDHDPRQPSAAAAESDSAAIRYRVQLEKAIRAVSSRTGGSCSESRRSIRIRRKSKFAPCGRERPRTAPGGATAEAAGEQLAGPSASQGRLRSVRRLDEDRKANNLVQSYDPRIVALARQAAGSQTDPWEVAVALEKFTHDYVTGRNFSKAFSTAVEVAESRERCLHAARRACWPLGPRSGDPDSRRDRLGLHQKALPGFAFHMWERGLDWRSLDSPGRDARRRGIGRAAHLKLADPASPP